MSNTLTPIDISTMPELARIVEEVAATQQPRELKRDNQTVAVCLRVIILPLGGALSSWLSRPLRSGLDNHVDNAPPTLKINVR